MTRKRIHYTPDDPDKFTLEEMTEKTEYPSLIDMKKKSVIIGANISTTVALFLLVTAVVLT
jgi:hypothetical protein